MLNVPELTTGAFEEIALLPENRDKRLEFILGRMTELVSNSYSSQVAAAILTYLNLYVLQHQLGRVTGADGGYKIGDDRYIPDVAFVSKTRQPEPSFEAYNSVPPDLAVQVLSPSDQADDVRVKIVNYLQAGVAVWLVDPVMKRAEVYLPNKKPQRLDHDGVIDGGDLLPGFTLTLKDVF
jgi:Uma2 family endonuclease